MSHLRRAVLQFYRNLKLRGKITEEIDRLGPWYQPINFGYGVIAKARSKTHKLGFIGSLRTSDRGIRKWTKLVEPSLPFDLKGKRVLEVGCNAGLFLHVCVERGAREAVGLEKDDRYYTQAKFTHQTFSQLNDRYTPVRIYQGSMETFDYSSLGNFDLALLLLVIYHIGKSDDYRDCTLEEVERMQVQTIERVAAVSRFQLFQGNPLKDEGRGKGRPTLLGLIDKAGLEIVEETTYDHSRGYLVLTRSPSFSDTNSVPINRLVNKYFQPALKCAERIFVDRYVSDGSVDSEGAYYRLRTGKDNWLSPGVANLPSDLAVDPQYWIMPWSVKPRVIDDKIRSEKQKTFPTLSRRFCGLIDDILSSGYKSEDDAIPVYQLVHPEHGEAFIYIDGNHRMGILAHIALRDGNLDLQVPVQIRQVIHRDRLLDYPLTRQLIEEGHFSEADAVKWFDNAFVVLDDVAI